MRGSLTTAHPLLGADDCLYNFATKVGMGYTLFRVRPGQLTREAVAHVPSRHRASPGWMHAFALTDTKAVLLEVPMYFNLLAMLPGAEVPPYCIGDWRPEEGARLHVISLADGAVRSVNVPTFFFFHIANAFDRPDGSLCVDVAAYDDPEIIRALRLEAITATPTQDLPRSRLERITIPPAGGGDPTFSRIEDLPASVGEFFEMPCVSPHVLRQPYRYVYGICAARPTSYANSLTKVDLSEPSATRTWHEVGCHPSEPVFVPRPGGTAEDDGVVLSVVTDAERSFLLVLDGASFGEVARAYCPYALPTSFHGTFIQGR